MTKKTLRKFHDQLVKGNLEKPKEEVETIERDGWIYIFGRQSKNLLFACSKKDADLIVGEL